jgi:hypothetical protein
MSIAQSHVNGSTIPLAEIEKPMASVQAAWRFYINPATFKPINDIIIHDRNT